MFSDSAENSFDRGENAGCQYFLLFPKCFPSILPKDY